MFNPIEQLSEPLALFLDGSRLLQLQNRLEGEDRLCDRLPSMAENFFVQPLRSRFQCAILAALAWGDLQGGERLETLLDFCRRHHPGILLDHRAPAFAGSERQNVDFEETADVIGKTYVSGLLARGRWQHRNDDFAQLDIVGNEPAFTLVDANAQVSLIVDERADPFRATCGHNRVALDNRQELTVSVAVLAQSAHDFDTERIRRNVGENDLA